MPAMTRPEPRGVSASDDFREQQRADFRAAMCREYEERVKQQAAAQFIMAMKASAPTERKTGLLAHAWVERARKSLEQSPIEADAIAAAGDGGELCLRVAKGDDDGVAAALAAGSAATSELGGYPALVLGTVGGHAAILQRLLAARADVDAQEHELHATALYVAADLGHDECVGVLLGAGAAVDQPTAEAATPLLVACYQGRVRCAELLLAAQADAGACMVGGVSPPASPVEGSVRQRGGAPSARVAAARVLGSKHAVPRSSSEGLRPGRPTLASEVEGRSAGSSSSGRDERNLVRSSTSSCVMRRKGG